MTKKNMLKLVTACNRAIKAHLKNGGTLMAGDFYLPETKATTAYASAALKCKCPIQLVVEKYAYTFASSENLSSSLNIKINRDEMYAFINGFDKRKNNWTAELDVSKETYTKLHKLGLELRKRFKVLTKPQINKIMGFPYV
jgi:hypothetical protein